MNWDVWLVGQEGSCGAEMFLGVAIALSTSPGVPLLLPASGQGTTWSRRGEEWDL